MNTININIFQKEVDTGHASQISESASEKLFNSIIKIEIDNKIGTGFFMKTNIYEKEYKFICTNFHIINQNDVNLKKKFNFFYGKKGSETKKSIRLDENERFIKCFDEEKEDITLIEIIKGDKIPENKYLLPDLNYKNGFNLYLKENFYLAGYPKVDKFVGDRHITSGKIIQIKDFEFYHNLDTRAGSSGSPICLLHNQCVIGIHRGGNAFNKINKGTFIGAILDDITFEIGRKIPGKKYKIISDRIKNLEKSFEEQWKNLSQYDRQQIEEILGNELNEF